MDRSFTDVQCHPKELDKPRRWKRPRMVFVNSMSDLFHPAVSDAFVNSVLEVICDTPAHTYQVLTKRSDRIRLFTYPDNCWVGVSVEDQRRADERMPQLLNADVGTRFLSCEPLLGPLDLGRHLDGLHWVIVGGESGPKARWMDPDWARDVMDQCNSAGVPFFMKQMTQKRQIPADLMIREYPHNIEQRVNK